MAPAQRRSVDLSAYPDLVVIYLGYRVKGLSGLPKLMEIGKALADIQKTPPDGLLAHEGLWFGFLHPGFRQYWRDLESLERFTKAPQHASWWRDFGRGNGGGGIWHETYLRRGGMEAVYLDVPLIGFGSFAPERKPVGPFITARQRIAA